MPRSLDPAVLAEKDESATSPAVVLRIDFPEPEGTRYYSDRELSVAGLEIEPRIVEAGRISRELSAGRRPSVADARIALRDEDGSLRAALASVELQGAPVTVYQHFVGLSSPTMTPLLAGVAGGPVEYREDSATVAFDVTDISRKWALDVGHTADIDDFPRVDPRDEGRMLPVVFGRVKRARARCVRTGRRGKLLRDCTPEDATLYASGFEDLPAGSSVAVEIGRERLTGTISGTVLTVSQRGGGTIAGGTVTHQTGRHSAVRDANLPGVDNEYVGCLLKIWIPGGYSPGDIPYEFRIGGASQVVNPSASGYEYRLITRFDASTGTIEYWPPFTVEGTRSESPALIVYGTGHVKVVPVGTAYEITTLAAFHRAGDRVRETVEGGWTYILNDAPSVRVDAVYLFGRRVLEPAILPRPPVLLGGGVVGVLGSEGLGEEDPPLLENDWIPVAPELYSVDLCDTATFPGLGRAVTTVTFRSDPTALPGYSVAGADLRADISGVDSGGDGEGALVENPAEVIRTILVRWGGLDPESDIDGDAFDEAAERLERTRFAFALKETRDHPTVAAELAFQATGVLVWRAGRASMRVLPRGAGAPDHTLDSDDRAEGSLVLSWDDFDDLATSVAASFTDSSERRELVVRDDGAAGAWGVRTRSCSLWAYAEPQLVREAARFWLSRWSSIRRRARLSTFLQGLAVEPGDVVELSCEELGEGTYNAEVQSVGHRPGSARDGPSPRRPAGTEPLRGVPSGYGRAGGRMDRIDVELRLPVWAGCESSCELACETGCESACEAGCESSCESSCELACEASCQNVCELDCAAAAESLCQSACMATGCEVACEVLVTGLDEWDCGACESACQVSCEVACEALCESLCESACETACESGCESGCESACESGTES